MLPFTLLKTQLEAAMIEHAQALADRAGAYQSVLAQLVMRIEAAASFTEESCSFSQADFAGGLHDWLARLESRIKTAP